MTSNLSYELGKSLGKLFALIEKSVEMNKSDNVEALKIKYIFIMENLFDFLEHLEESKISEKSLHDVNEELERLIDNYGEIKYDEQLPRGKRFIGGFKKKFALIRQNRKTIKTKDLEILLAKLKLWDDRLIIAFSS
ncbi:MAG: hypothetical protein HeimC2_25610 [Candidatus Heimdallarchaeota archaeon LC_2]|nr:MAG: hypothetical protein HeimC2_25610 [Candidatus Heimdallarchaeota archaeon LC_2]